MPEPAPRYRHPRRVLFQEIDAAGIVFYGRVFDYFHDAFAAFLADGGVDFPAILAANTWGAPLVHAEADYRRPMRFGDEIVTSLSLERLGETSMTLAYAIVAARDDGAVHCTGRTVHAFIDRASYRPRPVPSEIRAIFDART